MIEVETIAVYMRTIKGETVCICPANGKKCGRPCAAGKVKRDKFEGWESTMRRNRYGK